MECDKGKLQKKKSFISSHMYTSCWLLLECTVSVIRLFHELSYDLFSEVLVITSAGAKPGTRKGSTFFKSVNATMPPKTAAVTVERRFPVALARDTSANLVKATNPESPPKRIATCPRRSKRFFLATCWKDKSSRCSIVIVLGENTLGNILWNMASKMMGRMKVTNPRAPA